MSEFEPTVSDGVGLIKVERSVRLSPTSAGPLERTLLGGWLRRLGLDLDDGAYRDIARTALSWCVAVQLQRVALSACVGASVHVRSVIRVVWTQPKASSLH